MRGALAAMSQLQSTINGIVDRKYRETEVNFSGYEDFKSDELCWQFETEIKELGDCTKEELLDICKILSFKLAEKQGRKV